MNPRFRRSLGWVSVIVGVWFSVSALTGAIAQGEKPSNSTPVVGLVAISITVLGIGVGLLLLGRWLHGPFRRSRPPGRPDIPRP